MVANLLRDVAVLLVVPDIFKRLALGGHHQWAIEIGVRREKRTSIGLKGLAIRPIVDE